MGSANSGDWRTSTPLGNFFGISTASVPPPLQVGGYISGSAELRPLSWKVVPAANSGCTGESPTTRAPTGGHRRYRLQRSLRAALELNVQTPNRRLTFREFLSCEKSTMGRIGPTHREGGDLKATQKYPGT